MPVVGVGVYWCPAVYLNGVKGCYEACIDLPFHEGTGKRRKHLGTHHHLGYFASKEDASLTYDLVAVKHGMPLNFSGPEGARRRVAFKRARSEEERARDGSSGEKRKEEDAPPRVRKS